MGWIAGFEIRTSSLHVRHTKYDNDIDTAKYDNNTNNTTTNTTNKHHYHYQQYQQHQQHCTATLSFLGGVAVRFRVSRIRLVQTCVYLPSDSSSRIPHPHRLPVYPPFSGVSPGREEHRQQSPCRAPLPAPETPVAAATAPAPAAKPAPANDRGGKVSVSETFRVRGERVNTTSASKSRKFAKKNFFI